MAFSKKIEVFRCETCYDNKYKIDLNIDSSINITLCPECIPKLNLPEDVIINSKVKCKTINEQKLDPEQTTFFKTYMKDLSKSKDNEIIVTAINSFIANQYLSIKKENKHLEILRTPEKFKMVRDIAQHQFTALHLFTRNQVFQIISKENRSKFTEVSKLKGEIADIPIRREFLGWGGNLYFEISGPILCDYDQSVFDALTKIWNEKSLPGIILETNISEIWRGMGNNSELGTKNRISIKRSLSRLHKVSIEVKSMDKRNKNFWGGGIIDNVTYIEGKNSKNNKVIVNFNLHMAANYLQGSYATLCHPVYINLSAYSKKIYMYLMSHDNSERKIGLDKLRALLGVSEDILDKSFYIKLNNAIKELKEKNILEERSKIERNVFHSFITKDAWNARPINSDPEANVL